MRNKPTASLFLLRLPKISNKTTDYCKARYLVHTSCVKSHDGRVSKSVKDSTKCLFGVQILRLEQFFHEL